VAPSLGPYYLATLLAEGAAVAVLLHHVMRRETLRPAQLSVPVLRQMLAYGLPMLAFELSGITLHLGDRFVIEAALGANALGVYSAAYGLCGMASSVLVESYQRAITPTAMRLWETQGAPECGRFLGRMLHIYLIGATAVMAVSAALGGDLLAVLASEKYREGAAVVPWVMAGVLIGGLMPFVGAGLYMVKRTRALMGLLMLGAAVNMALNVALIPAIGLVGAAVATFAANVVMAVCATRVGRMALPVPIDRSAVLRLAVIGAGACAVMGAGWHPFDIRLLDLGLTIALGCALIAAAVLWLDPVGRTFRPTPREQGEGGREPTRP
jgi:O-antigen/teichoic acid export membrane protein